MSLCSRTGALAAFASLGLLGGCQPIVTTDGGGLDGGVVSDASAADAPVIDAGNDAATDVGPPTAVFVAPHEGDDPSVFFDLPWPNEARLTPAGTPDFASFPAPSRGLVREYLDAIAVSQDGWSTMGSVYFRFTHALDANTLPDSLESSVASDASVFLVPLTEGATSLERHPAIVRFEPRVTEYWPGNTLAIRPADGFPLLPDTLYAAVVTDAVRTSDGATFDRDTDFEAVMASDASVAELVAIYEPALASLDAMGVDRASILSLAVFRTQDPTALLATSADWVHDEMTAPEIVADAWSTRESTMAYTVLHGRYRGAPTFQQGENPYRSEGGGVRLGPDGRPVVMGTFEARFALAVPSSPMPEAGYPIVLYGHGTGGDFRSFLDDQTAALLAEQGIASMGIDAPIHGERNPTMDDTLFFNILNPDAVRCNPIQAALDHAAQAVVAEGLVVPRTALERDGREIHFDASRIYYVGHSQGALVGPLFFGVDDTPRAALFSAGGSLIGHTLREKTLPVDIPALVRSLLGFSGASTAEAFEREGFTLEHPIVTVLQGWVDISDPGNYGPLAVVRPRAGFAPRSVILTEGLMDEYVAPAGMEALATAFRVPVAAPVSREIGGLQFLGVASELGEIHANLPGGRTGALFQFPDQGHFAFFRDMRGRERIAAFFGSLLTDGDVGTIPAP
jgi:predicted esterase